MMQLSDPSTNQNHGLKTEKRQHIVIGQTTGQNILNRVMVR